MSTGLAGNPKIVGGKDESLIITKINKWTKYTQNWIKWKEVAVKVRTFKQ
jgi:hypothetical protein